MNIKELDNDKLIQMYSEVVNELKGRNIIRTKNVLGDLAEYLVIDKYNKTSGLPNLQAAPVGTQNVDAISRMGERYSIKATTGTVTGTFHGLEPKGSSKDDKQRFEYVVICKFDENYRLKAIYELTWDSFVKYKKWHSTMKAWNINLSKEVIQSATMIYEENR